MALVPKESTFLTSLNADRRKALGRQQKRKELLDDMDKGSEILKLHSDLQSLADDLDERVEGKLNANENAFFLAYKSFMYTVQKEFKELKQKADEEETKTRRDAKIQSLEKELDWFMNEALRLDELCKKYKKDLDKWKGEADALEDDRRFLENQIKSAKKNNKSLRNAVEKAQTSAYSALVAGDDSGRQAQGQAQAQPALPAVASEKPSANESPLSVELEQRYQYCVKRLKQQLETEQRLAAKLRAVADQHFSEPSELESFFVQCVDRVKANITERRQAQLLVQSEPKGRRRQESGARQQASQTQTLAPAASASMEDFTATDRRQVVQMLLSNKQVIAFLQEKLHPKSPDASASF